MPCTYCRMPILGGDDAKDGVVDDEHDDDGVGGHRGDRRPGQRAGQVATQPK